MSIISALLSIARFIGILFVALKMLRGGDMSKISGSNMLNYFEWCVIRCGCKNKYKKEHVLKR